MSMYNRVMVAYIDNLVSRKALREAVNIVKLHRGTLCVVHVTSSEDTAKQEEGYRVLETGLAFVRSVDSALQVETQLLTADPIYGLTGVGDAIVKASEDWGASLLVLGTASRKGLKLFVVGSVAETIVKKVDASILLVSSGFQVPVL
ncbi:universal stress protein [Desulfobulbus alkaliphilus]|uniref:universal stress protein n=1 Tax=Desulfobulbus alkaliphilus TaxID=869814 RepID=UPI001964523C|nr:universal stress protein [Desulfobulbus alkaliphilus]MBM9536605.1 universal stress protein [Desulfobulbus alkaliphilus]